MKKSTFLVLGLALSLGGSAILAETGVVVHEKNGNTTFFSSEDVEYVEFVDENYSPSDQLKLTSNIKDLGVGSKLDATAVVTAQSSRGLILTDNAGSIFYYNNNVNLGIYKIGTVVNVSGEVSAYGTGLQLSSSASMSVVGEKQYKYPVPTVYNGTMIDQAVKNTDNVLSTYVTLEGRLSINGNYYNIDIPGSAYQGSMYAPVDNILSKLIDGETYTYTGYFTGITSGKYFYMVLTDVQLMGENNGSNQDPGTVDGYMYPLSYVALPEGTPQQVKEYTGFTVNFNKDNHTPNYVAWELLSSEASGSEDRNNYSYWVDTTLEGCLDTDYAYSTTRYERGHMCPAADSKWSAAAMKDCMVMSNMCPQLSAINSGIWATLENKERDWAKRDGAIWIIAGPVYYDTDTQYIGRAKARVPSAFFKAFLYNNGTHSRAIAFVFTNGTNPGNLESYAMSIDDLEQELGYDLFSALPDDIEETVESTFNFADWNK